jgi:ferredoxin
MVSTVCDTTYTVTFVDEAKGLRTDIQVCSDEYIFDAAEEQGINLPAACRAGACIACTGKVLQGQIEQDHTFLSAAEIEQGFVLTCKAYARSNCVILTHQEDALLDF